jgi:hypothetical protein
MTMEIKSKFGFGQVLKDKVSGFEGAVMGIFQYATGCVHYGLAPLNLDKDGKVIPWENFDESRLEDTGKIRDIGPLTIGKPAPEKTTSGPVSHPENK